MAPRWIQMEPRRPKMEPRWSHEICRNQYKYGKSIENEKNNNPRLQVSSKEEYAEIMKNLNLANPKMMDIAVPANVKGLTSDQI